MALSKRPFKTFGVKEMGGYRQFLMCAVLEWILIASLFLDGLLAFLSSTFARIFDLEPPCVLCTRVDHALAGRDPNTFYNDSICECHKIDISSLAYCHAHGKLADIQNMCEGCLLSFATEKDSENAAVKSLLGSLRKDNNVIAEDNRKVPMNKCSCCSEHLKTRASSEGYARSFSNLRAFALQASSPKTEDSRYAELKFLSDFEPDMPEYYFGHSEDMNDEFLRTPNLLTSNKFFGIPLTDSSAVSPRLANKIPNTLLEKSDSQSEMIEEEGDSSLQILKKQARIDRERVLTLSMELDEERSAAAVAANNAMAMITRLQAEKAAVQMEASQYRRMMEEQAEYNQEALRVVNDLLSKRDEQVKAMESELESYREKYGEFRKVGSEECEVDADEYYQEWRSQSLSSFGEKSESGSPLERDSNDSESHFVGDHDESESPFGESGSSLEPRTPLRMNEEDDESHSGRSIENERVTYEEPLLDFEAEKYELYGMLKNLENHIQSSSMEDEWDEEDTDTVQENRASLKREVSLIRERLRALEADSGFLKHTAMTLQKGEKGAELLTEIAHHLRKMRNSDTSEDIHTADT